MSHLTKLLPFSLSLLATLSGHTTAQADLPRTFFAIHCEPQTARPQMWNQLTRLVDAAEQRNIVLTLEFTPQWAQMIRANPTMVQTLIDWQSRRHAVAAHHHDVQHAGTWDGYSSLPPSQIRRAEPYLGTMDDYKRELDLLVEAVGGESLQTASLDEEEWVYGIPYRTNGARSGAWTSQPHFEINNQYSYWAVSHSFLSTPLSLAQVKAAHAAASSDDVIGAVTHVHNFQTNPTPILAWFDHLAGLDPNGERNFTATELLGGSPDAFSANKQAISVSTRDRVDLRLATDATLAGDMYQVFTSLSGSDPGITLGGNYTGNFHIGLNPDLLTSVAVGATNTPMFARFAGMISPAGGATATFDTLGPLGVPPGFDLTFVCIAVGGGVASYSSNPVTITTTF